MTKHRIILTLAALVAGLSLGTAVFASMPATDIQGTIEAVNYGAHTITVNGQLYHLDKHVHIFGALGIGALQPGMKVDLTVAGTPEAPSSHLLEITVNPTPPLHMRVRGAS